GHRLDRPVRADRHEHGGRDVAARRVQDAGARVAQGREQLEREAGGREIEPHERAVIAAGDEMGNARSQLPLTSRADASAIDAIHGDPQSKSLSPLRARSYVASRMITNPHDAIFKAVFGQPEHARGALRTIAPEPLAEA